MDMWVMLQLLVPGMQHAEEADLGAEVLRIGGDLQECRSRKTGLP
jgi:hypothetical protein